MRLRQCAQIPPHIQAKLDGSTIALDIDVKHADVCMQLLLSYVGVVNIIVVIVILSYYCLMLVLLISLLLS